GTGGRVHWIGFAKAQTLTGGQEADRAIGIGEIALIGEQLVVEAENGVAREDLAQRQRITAVVGDGGASVTVENRLGFDLTSDGVLHVLVHSILATAVD